MKKIVTGALAAVTLAGALTAALPAAADEHHGWRGGGWHEGYRGGWRGGYRDGWRGDGAAAALLGLAAGAAIAGGGAYYGGYYAPPPAYYYAPRCRVEMRWNPYWGGYDRVRVCY